MSSFIAPLWARPSDEKIHTFQKMYNSPQTANRVYFIFMLSLLTCKNCDCTLCPGVLQPRFQSRYQTRFDFEGGGANDRVILVDNSFANYSHLRVSIHQNWFTTPTREYYHQFLIGQVMTKQLIWYSGYTHNMTKDNSRNVTRETQIRLTKWLLQAFLIYASSNWYTQGWWPCLLLIL